MRYRGPTGPFGGEGPNHPSYFVMIKNIFKKIAGAFKVDLAKGGYVVLPSNF
jgi:hypothetical protein